MSQIYYQFDFKKFREHLVDVTLTFTADNDDPIVWLPAWIAGSYMIREFSKHITAVTATIHDPMPITISALKNLIKTTGKSTPNKATALASLMKSMLMTYRCVGRMSMKLACTATSPP